MASQPMLLVYAGPSLASKRVRPVVITGTESLHRRMREGDPAVWQAILAVVTSKLHGPPSD